MHMKLKNYIWEIYSIARENNAQTDVARDMFIANLNQKTERYKGATVDYEALGEDWKSMTKAEQHHEKVEFNEITRTYLVPLSKAWKAKDREAFESVIANIDKE